MLFCVWRLFFKKRCKAEWPCLLTSKPMLKPLQNRKARSLEEQDISYLFAPKSSWLFFKLFSLPVCFSKIVHAWLARGLSLSSMMAFPFPCGCPWHKWKATRGSYKVKLSLRPFPCLKANAALSTWLFDVYAIKPHSHVMARSGKYNPLPQNRSFS